MSRPAAGALVALAIAAAPTLAVAPSAAADPAQPAEPPGPRPPAHGPGGASPPTETGGRVRLVVRDITPAAARPGSVLRIRGLVTGRTAGLSVRLRWSPQAFTSRGYMDVYAQSAHSPRFDTDPLPQTRTDVTGQAQTGNGNGGGAGTGRAKFALTLPVDRLGLQRFGVYPLAVEVLSGGQPVARQRTFLPFVPKDTGIEPTRIGWLWPLIDRPHRSVGGTFVDGSLARTLSPQGRLGRLLSAAAKAPSPANRSAFPLLWSVDPALLQAAQSMTDGYRIRGPGGDSTDEQEPSTVADRWLTRLRAASGQTVLSMPYADPDVMALHRAGLGKNLALSVARGSDITEAILNRRETSDVVWPPGGWLSPSALDALAVGGTDALILNGQSYPPARRLTYTPNAATSISTIGGKTTVLIADSELTDILGGAASRPGSPALAEQRFLAETALITAERPYETGTVLAAPPRRWNPPPGFAADVLADTVRVPWLRPVGRSSLLNHPANVERSGLRYPPSARRAELAQRYLAPIARAYRDMQRLAGILEPRTSEFDFAILRTESSAWRARPALGTRLRRQVRNQLSRKRAQVRIVTRGPLPLASNQGTLPVTVANGLTEHTVVVGLELRPRNRARLEVGDIPRRIRIQPGHKVTVKVPVKVATSGVTDLRAQLHTAQGRDYGEPVRLKIRATGYGTAALAVTGGAFGVLVLAIATRFLRRLRARGGMARGGTAGNHDHDGPGL